MSTEIRNRLITYLLEVCDIESEDEITDDSSLKEDLCLNSMEAINMIADLEDAYGFKIEDTEILSLKTVKDVIKLVESKIN